MGKEVGSELVEADEGAVDFGASLFGGGEEFELVELEIEVGIGARSPALGKEVAVEVVAALAGGADEGEGGGVFCFASWAGPRAAGRGSAVFFAGVVAKVDLEGGEDFEEGAVDA